MVCSVIGHIVFKTDMDGVTVEWTVGGISTCTTIVFTMMYGSGMNKYISNNVLYNL